MTLHCLLFLMHYNVASLRRTVVTTVFVSLARCRISTNTGCAGRRRPITVYHEEHGVEAVGVG